jgi:DNA-binding LytR/AlgR family response regulator
MERAAAELLAQPLTRDNAVRLALVNSPALQALLAQLRDQTRRPPALQVIQAAVGKEVRLIPVAEVIYFESDARYTRVV